MDRRQLLKAFGTASAASLLRMRAEAQSAWPARNIAMIVPFPPVGQADLAARPVAAALEKIVGHGVIVENRGGAGGAVGNAAAAKAEPDGYTLLMPLSSLAVLPQADRLLTASRPTRSAAHAGGARPRRPDAARDPGLGPVEGASMMWS